ncbi:conserved hypothetical protein [Burkholderia latens]
MRCRTWSSRSVEWGSGPRRGPGEPGHCTKACGSVPLRTFYRFRESAYYRHPVCFARCDERMTDRRGST